MGLSDDVERIAEAASRFASEGERLSGVVAAELRYAGRVYLCSFDSGSGRAWLALDETGAAIARRDVVREAAQLAALCEVAEESAGGGDLPQLRLRLAELRETDAPEGLEAAEEAAAALAAVLEGEPRLASTDRLDLVGAAARRLEQALGEDGGSPFAAAMQQAMSAVDELAAEIERAYKGPLA